jgi:hypothetical protein
MIVGLDISTSCTGICFLFPDGTVHSVSHVDLKKEKSFYKKVDAVRNFLKGALEDITTPLEFFIEAPLLHFKLKASMASTIALLQKFNASVCYSIYNEWKIEPKLINVLAARKKLGVISLKGAKKKNIKQNIFEQIKSRNVIPEHFWAYKKTGTPKDWCYDRVDAYVIARAGYLGDQQ